MNKQLGDFSRFPLKWGLFMILLHIGGGDAMETGERCEYVNITSNTCSSAPCTAHLGHVCYVLECKDCSELGARKKVCVKVDGKCLIAMCDDLTWLQAESKCQKTGNDTGWTMTLARNFNTSIDPNPLASINPVCREFWMDCQCSTKPRNSTTRNEGNAIGLIVMGGIAVVMRIYWKL